MYVHVYVYMYLFVVLLYIFVECNEPIQQRRVTQRQIVCIYPFLLAFSNIPRRKFRLLILTTHIIFLWMNLRPRVTDNKI